MPEGAADGRFRALRPHGDSAGGRLFLFFGFLALQEHALDGLLFFGFFALQEQALYGLIFFGLFPLHGWSGCTHG